MKNRPENGTYTSHNMHVFNYLWLNKKYFKYNYQELIGNKINIKDSIWGFGKTKEQHFVNQYMTTADSYPWRNRSKTSAK